MPGCAALGPAWARHGRFVPLGVSNLGSRRSSITLARGQALEPGEGTL